MSTDVDNSTSDLAIRAWRERRRAGLGANPVVEHIVDPQQASDYADEVMVFSLVADAFRTSTVEEVANEEVATSNVIKTTASFKVGDIFWDRHYHPVLCSQVEGQILTGVSLFDGSNSRVTELTEHTPKVLTADEVSQLIQMRKDFLVAEKKFNETGYNHRYKLVLEKLNWTDVDLENL